MLCTIGIEAESRGRRAPYSHYRTMHGCRYVHYCRIRRHHHLRVLHDGCRLLQSRFTTEVYNSTTQTGNTLPYPFGIGSVADKDHISMDTCSKFCNLCGWYPLGRMLCSAGNDCISLFRTNVCLRNTPLDSGSRIAILRLHKSLCRNHITVDDVPARHKVLLCQDIQHFMQIFLAIHKTSDAQCHPDTTRTTVVMQVQHCVEILFLQFLNSCSN